MGGLLEAMQRLRLVSGSADGVAMVAREETLEL